MTRRPVRFEFILQGETPAKKNSRITLRNGRTIPSKRYMQWHKIQSVEILRQKMLQKIETIFEPVVIKLEFTHGDFIRRDSDNGVSSILDLLVDCKVLEDDNWKIVQRIVVANYYDKKNANCKITVSKLGDL